MNRYEILLEYNSAIRKLVNGKVGKTKVTRNPSESTLQWIKRQFKFNKEEDWGLLCASMDLVGDTSLAIQNFERFKLEGPTKYEELGEKYLRLYGLLNAIYLQQRAVQCMYGVFQVPGVEALRTKIQALRIAKLRHKLASHTLNYRDSRASKLDWFVVSQNDLGGTKAAFMSFLTDQYEKVDLLELMQQHLELMTASLDKVFEKAINTVYKTSREKRKAFLEELKLLRAQVSGDIVVSLPEQGKVLRFVPANKKKSNKQ